MTTPDDVLRFWFVETPVAKHFARDAALDAAIAARFGALHAELAALAPDRLPEAWQATPHALLATIIVLDQFSRNLFRDDTRAFASDPAARALLAMAQARGDAAVLTPAERQFLVLPLMHSEDPADQQRSVEAYTALGDAEVLKFAESHRDTIARFGRFPARNAALGRVSTPAEVEFLRGV